MTSIQDEILRATAEADDDLMIATAGYLLVMAGDLRDLVASIQLCVPADEGVPILSAAADQLEGLAEVMQQHPGAARELAARRLRGAMRVVQPASPTPTPTPPPEAFWRMLGALAGEAVTLIPGKRDRNSLLRVASIASHAAAALTTRSRKGTRGLTVVPTTSGVRTARPVDVAGPFDEQPGEE